MRKKSGFVLIVATLILLAAFFLRLHRLASVPPGITYDEGQLLWDAVRISRYGWIPAYNDTRAEPLNRYIQGALMAVGGRTAFTGRLLTVYWGMFSVTLAYRATSSLFYGERYRRGAGLFGAGMIAVMANPITLSHFADRGTFMVVVMMAGVHFLAQAWHRNSRWFFTLAGFLFFGSVHTYTAAVFFPFTLIPILLHQALFNFRALRERLAGLPYLAMGALPPVTWWLWQFSRPGPLYWRNRDIGVWQKEGLGFFVHTLPSRMLATTQGLFLFGDCDPQFNVWSKPLLNPFLCVLALIGLGITVWRFRRFASGVLLTLFPIMLLPVALTVDIVHGRRLAGEWLVMAALAGLAVISIWKGLERLQGAAKMQAVFALALAVLLIGTGADSLHSYLSYLTLEEPETVICDGNPMDPYFYYLHDHVELGKYLNRVQVPTYVPIEELDLPAVHVTLSQNFPRTRSYSVLAEPGEPLNLPDGQVIVWPGQEESTHYGLLMPGQRLGQGTVFLLPPLSPEARDELASRLRTEAAPIPGSRTDQIGLGLALGETFNPFRTLSAPPIDLIATYANGMQLVGVDAPFLIEPGQAIPITLYWKRGNLHPVNDYYSSVTLIDVEGNGLANHYYWIMRWLYATAQWQANEVVPDGHVLELPPTLEPGAYRLRIGVAAEWANPQPLAATGPNGEPLGEFFPLGYLKVPLPEPDPMPDQAIATDISIGQLALQGYTLERNGELVTPGELAPGDTLTLTFYWYAAERLEGNYHLFIHVQQEADGEILAGWDGPPLGDRYPTAVWGPDERLATAHHLTIPEAEGLEFRIGMYEWPLLTRLPVRQAGVLMQDSRALLWSEP